MAALAIGTGWGIVVGVALALGGALLGWTGSDAYQRVVDYDPIEWKAIVIEISSWF